MALEQIAKAVLDGARNEADLIAKAAAKNVNERLAAARKAAEQDAERRFQAAVRAMDEELARKMIQRQGLANKAVLERKNALIGEVFTKARERIFALPAEEYAAIMARLLEKAAAGCGGKLRVHLEDNEIFTGIVNAYNEGRPESVQVQLALDEPLPERGGFIFVSDTFQVDQTLQALLETIEYELAPQIAQALFSERK